MVLSVIIPSYRATVFLHEALHSLAPYPHAIEVIVIENGSVELDQSDLQAIVPRAVVTLIREPFADLSGARNVGLAHARGAYVYFLDSDDVVDSLALADLVDAAATARADVGVMGARALDSTEFEVETRTIVDGSGGSDEANGLPFRLISGANLVRRALLAGSYSPVLGQYLFSRSFFESTGVTFAEGYFHEDHAVAFQCLVTAKVVIDTPRVMFYKRLRQASLTRSISQTDSITGYCQAVEDLHRYGSAADSPSVANLRQLIISRLRTIVAVKKLRVDWGSQGVVGLGSLGSLVVASVRYGAALVRGAIQPRRRPESLAHRIVGYSSNLSSGRTR